MMGLFIQDFEVKDMFCGAPSDPEPSLSFGNYLLDFGLKPAQDDCAPITDEADGSVALTELKVASFRECNNQHLSPWSRPFGCSLDPFSFLH